jgi:hypothetical protein
MTDGFIVPGSGPQANLKSLAGLCPFFGAPALATELPRLSRAEIGYVYPAHRPLQPSLESACREERLLLAQDV